MTPHSSGRIFLDEDGNEIERPRAPSEGASIEDKIAHMRAVWAYNDRVRDIGSRAFADQFRKSLHGNP